jgi:hypothetical protein
MKNQIFALCILTLLSSCKKELTVGEVAGNWIQSDKFDYSFLIQIKLTFNSDGTGTTNYGTGAFRYSLSDGTLDYNVRAEPTWKIKIIDSNNLTLSASSIVQHFTRVP